MHQVPSSKELHQPFAAHAANVTNLLLGFQLVILSKPRTRSACIPYKTEYFEWKQIRLECIYHRGEAVNHIQSFEVRLIYRITRHYLK